MIVSHHDSEERRRERSSKPIVDRCFRSGADIAKIACRVRSLRDNARLLGLLDDATAMVVVGLGKRGRMTRVAGPLAGGLFTFASRAKGRETAGADPRRALARLIGRVEDA